MTAARFVPAGNATHAYGALIGYIECSYAQLVDVFGVPNGDTDDYKVSTSFLVRDTAAGVTIEIYDYKATNLYDKSAPSVAQFRAEPKYRWHIGGMSADIASLAQFIHEKTAQPCLVPTFRGF